MGGRFSRSTQDKPTGYGVPLSYPYPAGYFGGHGWPSFGYGGHPPHTPAMSYLGEDHTYPTPSDRGTDRMQLVLVPTWVPVDNPGKRRQLFASAGPLSENLESQGRLSRAGQQSAGHQSQPDNGHQSQVNFQGQPPTNDASVPRGYISSHGAELVDGAQQTAEAQRPQLRDDGNMDPVSSGDDAVAGYVGPVCGQHGPSDQAAANRDVANLHHDDRRTAHTRDDASPIQPVFGPLGPPFRHCLGARELIPPPFRLPRLPVLSPKQ